MRKVLIVEDNPSDIRKSEDVLNRLGVQEIELATTVAKAIKYLDDVRAGSREAPDVIILDLSFSLESGFEVLRFWKSHAELRNIRIVVWTVMGELEQQLCRLFGVEEVVPKWGNVTELEYTLKRTAAV
jgi:CheY-like chemotaxis protein